MSSKTDMKKIFSTVITVLALASCQKATDYIDVVYFTGTEDDPSVIMYVDGPASKSLTVSASDKVSEDVRVSFVVDGALVDQYNAAHGTAYKMLPEGSYAVSSNTFTIKAGSASSLPLTFDIISMDDFEDGVQYCAPLRITGTSSGIEILKASQTMFIILNQIITTNVVDLGMSRYFSVPSMVDNAAFNDMGACTLECRVYMNGWQNSNPFISSVIGVEENFLVRFGDVSCDKNQLQYAGRGASITSADHFDTGRWYHVAVTDDGSTLTLYVDGQVQGTASSEGKSAINLAWNYMGGFHIGFSERGRLLNGYVSEARVWKRALSATELVNNQCYVDPASEGLMAYWRLGQSADGTTVSDMTAGGYDAVSSSAIVWVEGVKCPVVD